MPARTLDSLVTRLPGAFGLVVLEQRPPPAFGSAAGGCWRLGDAPPQFLAWACCSSRWPRSLPTLWYQLAKRRHQDSALAMQNFAGAGLLCARTEASSKNSRESCSGSFCPVLNLWPRRSAGIFHMKFPQVPRL